MQTRHTMFPLILLGGLFAWTGCQRGTTVEDPQILSERAKYLLSAEPPGAVGVSDARAALGENEEIVVVGRISAGDHEPWQKGHAAFLISDAGGLLILDDEEAHHHEPGHDPATCPFCNRGKSLTDSLAIVQFLNDSGEVLPIDSRHLLGVEKNQLVVVRGRGKLDELGNLFVAANGIYLRK